MRTLKKTLALVLVLAMVFSLAVTASADFTDAEKIEYAEEVELLTALGVIEGYPDGSFGPTKTLNRAEAAVMIARLNAFTDTTAATPTYTDMAGYNWSNWAVAYAENAGIVNGTAEGIYEPATTLTGYMWVKMLLVSLGYDAVENGMTGAAWQIGVAKLDKAVGISGGELDLSKAITREQAAMCAYNALFVTRDGITYAVLHNTSAEGIHVHYFDNEADAIAFRIANLLPIDTPILYSVTTGEFITSLGFEKFGLTPWDMGLNEWGQPFYGYYSYFLDDYLCVKYVPASVTYNTVVDVNTFYNDCVKAGIAPSSYDNTEKYIDVECVYINGDDDNAFDAAKGNDALIGFTGNGTMTYVYNTVYGVFVASIEQFIGKVVAEIPANNVTGAEPYVVIENQCDDESDCATYFYDYNSDLKLGDVVLFNVCYDEICNIKAPKTVSGVVTEIDTNVAEAEYDDVYTISGSKYLLSRHEGVTISGGDNSTWYVDDCGNLMLKKTNIAPEYKLGYLVSYDAQNFWAGDKNHTCEKYDASETFEIYDIESGKTLTLNGAVIVSDDESTTTFVAGATVDNTNATAADGLDLKGTKYNVRNEAGLSLGLVVYMVNEDGEVIYISDKQSGETEPSIKIQNQTKNKLAINPFNIYLGTKTDDATEVTYWENRWMNDSTEYVYAWLKDSSLKNEFATGLKNAKAQITEAEYAYETATGIVLAVAQYEVPVVTEEKPVVETGYAYVGGDYQVTTQYTYSRDALGNVKATATYYVVNGLYIDGVKQEPITFKASDYKSAIWESLVIGELYPVTITTTGTKEVWEFDAAVTPVVLNVEYIGEGYLKLADGSQIHLSSVANIIIVDDAHYTVSVTTLPTAEELGAKTMTVVFVPDATDDKDGNMVTGDLYYTVQTTDPAIPFPPTT